MESNERDYGSLENYEQAASSCTEQTAEDKEMPTCYYQYLHNHSQSQFTTDKHFREISSRHFQPENEVVGCENDQEIVDDGQPPLKKFRRPDQHKPVHGTNEETFFPLHGEYTPWPSRLPSPDCTYSDHFVTGARAYSTSDEITARDQSFWSEYQLVPRSLGDSSECSELPADLYTVSDGEEDFFVEIRKHMHSTSGRRNGICEELDADLKTVREQNGTNFDLSEISDQLQLLNSD